MKIRVNKVEELRRAVADSKIDEICLEDGIYKLTEPLVIARDNLRIYTEGRHTEISGVKVIPLPKSGEEVVKINLSDYDIAVSPFEGGPFIDFWEEYDIPKPHLEKAGKGIEVFWNGKPMELSRYPEKGYLRISRAYGEHSKMFLKKPNGCTEGIIETEDKDFYEIIDDDTLLIGYWSKDWTLQRHRIEKCEGKKIYLDKPYHFMGYRYGLDYMDETPGGRFFAVNARKAVDKPGKWCIDHKTQELYVYPYEKQTSVEVTVCDNLLVIKDCSNVSVENITFYGAAETAVCATNVKKMKISGCYIRDVGAWGIDAKGCTDSTICDCSVTATGGGGISLHGGDRTTLKSSNNLVCRNTLYEIAAWHRVYMAAIEINGVGITVSENKIYNVPHFAILHQGNNHIIERNEIENACYESNDAGAIYGGRDYTCRGLIIRHNYIHNMPGGRNEGCVGIYFDDGYSGAEVYGNIIANMPNGIGIELGGGRDFKIHNNYFFRCTYAILYDNRVKTWGDWLYDKLVKHLHEVDYKCDIWKEAYPELYSIMEDDIRQPLNNKIYDNIVCGGCGYIISSNEVADMTSFSGNEYISDIIPEEVDKWHTDWYNTKK